MFLKMNSCETLFMVLIIGFTVSGDVLCVNPDISRGVVYKRNGTLMLLCKYKYDPLTDSDIFFILHHNDKVRDKAPPTPSGPSDIFHNVFTIPNAGPDAAGSYTCNIEGKPDAVVSTSVKEVSVDETPVVGELGGSVQLSMLKTPMDRIKCYRTEPDITEVTDCKLNMKVTELSIGKHEFVIVSSEALEYYSSPLNAMTNYTSFNMTKELISIVIKPYQRNVTIYLGGSELVLSELELKCSREPSKVESIDRLRVFAFPRDDPSTPFTAEVRWKDKVLFSKNVDTTAGATTVQGNALGLASLFSLCIAVLHMVRIG